MEAKKSIYRIMRVLHRDIGFFVVGLTIIYCISGIMLTYRDTAFLKSETLVERNISPGLSANELGRALHLKDLEIVGQDDKMIRFTVGNYNKETGAASYTNQEIPALLKALNSLHTTSSSSARSLFTVLYAGLLSFLALSSFWMYKPGTKMFRRGLIISLLGIVSSVFLIMA